MLAPVERDGKVRFAVIDGRTMSCVRAAVRAKVRLILELLETLFQKD